LQSNASLIEKRKLKINSILIRTSTNLKVVKWKELNLAERE
jgi:hypothetical protein